MRYYIYIYIFTTAFFTTAFCCAGKDAKADADSALCPPLLLCYYCFLLLVKAPKQMQIRHYFFPTALSLLFFFITALKVLKQMQILLKRMLRPAVLWPDFIDSLK